VHHPFHPLVPYPYLIKQLEATVCSKRPCNVEKAPYVLWVMLRNGEHTGVLCPIARSCRPGLRDVCHPRDGCAWREPCTLGQHPV
jgi:hypothetical protein